MMAGRMSAEETKSAMQSVVSEMYEKIVKGEPPTMTARSPWRWSAAPGASEFCGSMSWLDLCASPAIKP